MAKGKSTNNDLQNIHIKLNSINRNPTKKTEGKHRCSGMVSGSCTVSGNRRVNLATNPV